VNGPSVDALIQYMTSRNIAVWCMDFEGHGYSEGVRALICNREDLINDFLLFVRVVLQDEITSGVDIVNFDESLCISDLHHIRSLPFGIMGSSMGGAVTALLSNDLMKFPNYCGSILLAPALSINPPSWLLVEFLRYTVCMVVPEALMPSSLSSVNDNRASLKHEDALARAALDTWGLPGALGWNQGLRWATALMFIDMAAHISKPETVASFKFPFLIIHDPGDLVCSIDGARIMMTESATAPADKKLVEVSGFLHAVLVNHNKEVCDEVLDWLMPRFAAFSPELN